MISIPAGARVLLATRPVDFRAGAHRLATLAQEMLGENPFSGAVTVYRAKRGDRVKILVWDTSGLVLIWKQLQQGSFGWPPNVDGDKMVAGGVRRFVLWTRLGASDHRRETKGAGPLR
jgi:transposase